MFWGRKAKVPLCPPQLSLPRWQRWSSATPSNSIHCPNRLSSWACCCWSKLLICVSAWFYEPYTVQCVTPRQLKWVECLMTWPLMIHKRIEVKETPFKTFKVWHDMNTTWKLLALEGILAVFPDNVLNSAKLPTLIILFQIGVLMSDVLLCSSNWIVFACILPPKKMWQDIMCCLLEWQ